MSVLVALFNQTTGWFGRTITYQEAQRQFILQDHGPITAQGILSYDALGQIEWAREGLREWARDFAEWEGSSRRETQAGGQPSPKVADASPAVSAVGEAEHELPARSEVPVCCPYCGVVLDPPPRTTKKCPVCGEKVHLKTVAGTGERRLMTEAEAAENDKAWGRFNLRKKAIDAAGVIGCSQEDFLRSEQDLAARWGHAPGPGDVFWSLANHAVGEAGAQSDWQRLSLVYWSMARWLHEEGKRDPFKLLRQASIAELQGGASMFGPQAKVEAHDCNDDEVCEACACLRGKRWTVAEALEEPPVPHPACANGFCRCGLSVIPPGMADEDL